MEHKHVSPITFTKISILDDIPMYPIGVLVRRAEELDISGSDFDKYIAYRMEREREKHLSDPEEVFKTFVFDKIKECEGIVDNIGIRVYNCLRRSLYGSDGYDICDKYWKIRKFADMTDEQVARIRNLGNKSMPVAFKLREKAREFIASVDDPKNKVVAMLKVMGDGHVDGYLTTEEYAKKHDMKLNTVQVMIERGNLEAIKVSGVYFIPTDQVTYYHRNPRNRNIAPDGYLSISEYARQNNLKMKTVWQWAKYGRIEYITVGNVKFIHKNAKYKKIEAPLGYLSLKDYCRERGIKLGTARAMICRGNLEVIKEKNGRIYVREDTVPIYKRKRHYVKKEA